ncbi:MAG: DUF1292 domain-containing protein [Clostridia bacterium]|nr:DUF1292 domain-containing protein [Clostridia bacterium]
MEEKIDILDTLLDEENNDPIILENERGEKIVFEQIAIIPKVEDLYCILKPVEPIDGLEEDEALVFKILENEEGEASLTLETDEDVIDEVFNVYYDLLDEEDGE